MNHEIIKAKSPNFNSRKPETKISTLVIHHTQLNSCKHVYDIFENSKSKVSSHYLIGRDGSLHQFVDEQKRAWHAGISWWRDIDGLNENSIGIELDNNGEEPFSEPLMNTLYDLSKSILSRYEINERDIIGHSDIAYWRKVDPSHHFDWEALAKNGIGFFPSYSENTPKDLFKLNGEHKEVPVIKSKLKKLGYKIDDLGAKIDQKTYSLLKAFKRRYDPKSYDLDTWNSQTNSRLNELLERYGY